MSRPPKKPSLALDSNIVQDNVPLEIVPKIFIGSIHAAFNQEALREMGITHILNASRLPATFPKQFTYLSVDIRDKENSNILSCIPASNIFIEAGVDAGGVLVHCFGGRSRSAAFIAAFLMSSYGWSYEQVVATIKAARPVASINRGFESQLKAYFQTNFDVYVAQQVLLRGRIRILHSLRKKSDDEQIQESFRFKESNRSAKSSGHKRSWGDLKGGVYDESDDEDDEEDQMYVNGKGPQLSFENLSREAGPKTSVPPRLPLSSWFTSGARNISSTTCSHPQIPTVDAKSPHCRLSKPGSNSVRVIPPLRGLERSFCCSWCGVGLFCLANVIRLDLDVLPHLNATPRAESKAGGVGIVESSLQSVDADLPLRSPRNGRFKFDSNLDTDQPQFGASKISLVAPTPSNQRNGGAKAFDFDFRSSEDESQNSTLIARCKESPVEDEAMLLSSIGDCESDATKPDDHPSSDGSYQGPSYPFRRETGDLRKDLLRDKLRIPSFHTVVSDGPRINSLSSARSEDSPRIPIPPHRQVEGASGWTWSPRDGTDRPQSTEKRRWLARLSLLRSVDPREDAKMSKMAEADDDALRLAFGREKYIYLEYLDWMGSNVLSNDVANGEISCHGCHCVLGAWTWRPSARQSHNGALEPPIIKIHKDVVQQADLALDQTPLSTPRLEESDQLMTMPGSARLSESK